ncbi:hypothetical protein ACSBR1_017509 [Camellia fascicularis]
MAAQAVSRMAGAEASPPFFLLDKNGLITKKGRVLIQQLHHLLKPPGRSRVWDLGREQTSLKWKILRECFLAAYVDSRLI